MISHKHRCIFVHIPKTAGQSVESVFLKDLGLTWKTRDPLLLRKNINPEISHQALAHLYAHEYCQYHFISRELFDEYFKFSFVRNPWARTYSFYKFLNAYPYYLSFEDFVLEELPKMMESDPFVRPQYEYLYHNGNCQVDFIGRFENLKEDFSRIAKKLGLSTTKLPHRNKSKNRTFKNILYEFWSFVKRSPGMLTNIKPGKADLPKNYRDIYTEDSKRKVAELYAKDIETFEYEF